MTFNKGEWSEIYAFCKIIEEARLIGCNSHLLPIENEFIRVVSLVKNQAITENRLEYYLKKEQVLIRENECIINSKKVCFFKEFGKNILEKIKSKQSGTFSVSGIDSFLKEIGYPSLKSRSSNKSDLTITILQPLTQQAEEYEFSLKSNLAASSTLLNASSGTNFIYTVNCKRIEQYQKSKAKELLCSLKEDDVSVSFEEMDSKCYYKNLLLIDTQMPLILSYILLYYFQKRGIKLIDLIKCLKIENPLRLPETDIYYEKISELLLATALGMVPKTPWDNLYKADGGLIVIKKDGSIVSFYIFKQILMKELKKYLIEHSFLDTPSTTRNQFGYLYEENNSIKLKLNLQIRLK